MPLSPPPELRVGIDVVAVERMERLLGEHEGAAATLFTERELRYRRGRRRGTEHLAARFAAKKLTSRSEPLWRDGRRARSSPPSRRRRSGGARDDLAPAA